MCSCVDAVTSVSEVTSVHGLRLPLSPKASGGAETPVTMWEVLARPCRHCDLPAVERGRGSASAGGERIAVGVLSLFGSCLVSGSQRETCSQDVTLGCRAVQLCY